MSELNELNANSVDPDQMPHSAASDLGLYCLPMSFYGTLGLNGLNCNSQKTYLQTCAPSQDSDQPANSHSLIRVFSKHTVKLQ